MIVVLDASSAVELVLKRERSGEVRTSIVEADWVIVPSMYVSEITNVFWKYHQFENLPAAVCEESIVRALKLPDEFVSEQDLFREAFSMACAAHMPAYDMFYLVLARRNDALLVTEDTGLRQYAPKQSVRVG